MKPLRLLLLLSIVLASGCSGGKSQSKVDPNLRGALDALHRLSAVSDERINYDAYRARLMDTDSDFHVSIRKMDFDKDRDRHYFEEAIRILAMYRSAEEAWKRRIEDVHWRRYWWPDQVDPMPYWKEASSRLMALEDAISAGKPIDVQPPYLPPGDPNRPSPREAYQQRATGNSDPLNSKSPPPPPPLARRRSTPQPAYPLPIAVTTKSISIPQGQQTRVVPAGSRVVVEGIEPDGRYRVRFARISFVLPHDALRQEEPVSPAR